MHKRQFLTAGLGLGIGLIAGGVLAQTGPRNIPSRKATTTKLFKAPGLYPNAIAVAPQGLWIGQQKLTANVARDWHVSVPSDRDEAAWLVDWSGKLLKTVTTHSRNTSGMAYGDDSIWMGANDAPWGVFQVGLDGKQISHRQIPLSLDGNGGGCHGLTWHDGKLWIAALRLGGALRVDPKTWTPEVLIRVASEEKPRLHGIAFDAKGDMWVVTGNNSTSYAEGRPGLNHYDGHTGALVETVELAPGSCDPHGLAFHAGKLISCDAGEHPGWKENESPSTGWIFSIDLA